MGTYCPKKPVEVLVAATLPWPVRVSEVTTYRGSLLQRLVAMELGAVVPSDGLERHAARPNELQHRPVDRRCRAIR